MGAREPGRGQQIPHIYEPHEADERRIGTAVATAAGFGGILGFLSRVPRSQWRAVSAGDSSRILNSFWWRGGWRAFQERLAMLLSRIAVESRIAVLRELAASINFPARLVARSAEALAAEFARGLSTSTGVAMSEALASMERDLFARQLAAELGSRIGPTPRQLDRILDWERRQKAAGVSRDLIRSGFRRQARAAALSRALATASSATVRQVSLVRSAAFEAAGVFVSSGNPLDKRTSPTHRTQTNTTRANPTPAGAPWHPSAPHRGLPPYPDNPL